MSFVNGTVAQDFEWARATPGSNDAGPSLIDATVASVYRADQHVTGYISAASW
jgi:hypothetical protein